MLALKKAAAIALLILLNLRAHSQYMDSLHIIFQDKGSFDAGLESRNSFINNQLISVNGVRLGVDFKNKLSIGGGLSWLNSDVKVHFYPHNDLGQVDTVTKYIKFMYLCYYIDFVFYKTKRWKLSVPLQLGTGLSWFQDSTAYRLKGQDRKYLLLLYEPGITVHYKIFKWFGLGADLAYRFTMKNNKKVGERLNSPTYSFSFLFWPDQLFYELFPKSRITKRFGPAEW